MTPLAINCDVHASPVLNIEIATALHPGVLQLEVMTNSDLAMLGDNSPYRDRIIKIMGAYDNVTFLACAQTVNKTENREGQQIKLIPNTLSEKSAREHIPVRLEQGWVYLKV